MRFSLFYRKPFIEQKADNSSLEICRLGWFNTEMIKKATIIGNGGMGSVCAMLLSENGLDTTLWGHDADELAKIAAAKENIIFRQAQSRRCIILPTRHASWGGPFDEAHSRHRLCDWD